MISNLVNSAAVGICVLLANLSMGVLYGQVSNSPNIDLDAITENGEIWTTAESVGLRALSEPVIVSLTPGKAGIDSDAFYKAADSLPTAKAIFKDSGLEIEDLPLNTVLAGLKYWESSSGYITNAKKINNFLNIRTVPLEYKKSKDFAHVLNSYSPTFIPLVRKPEIGYDAKLMPLLLSTELFGTSTFKTFDSVLHDQQIKFLSVEKDVGDDLLFATQKLENRLGVTPLSRVFNYNVAVSHLKAHKRLLAALELKTGTYTFGVPQIFKPEDLGIDIRPIYRRMHDVYVIIFWMTDRHLFANKVKESWFTVKLSNNALALELVPLRYEKVLALTEESNSPPITAKLGKTQLSVGQFYKNTISSTSFKPVIVAQGVQESYFGWAMRDEASAPGAKRFISVIGVERGTEIINITIAAASFYEHFLGLQGDISVVGEETRRFPLPIGD